MTTIFMYTELQGTSKYPMPSAHKTWYYHGTISINNTMVLFCYSSFIKF